MAFARRPDLDTGQRIDRVKMASMLLVIAFLARCVTSTTIIDLSQDWVVNTDAKAEEMFTY